MAQEIVPGTTTDRLVALIAKVVDQRLAEFSRSGFLNNASISKGDLTIRGGGNVILRDEGDVRVEAGGSIRVARPGGDTEVGNAVYIGPGGGTDTDVVQIIFRREDNSQAFQLQASTLGPSFWRWFAANGTELLSEDTVAGDTLARPYLHLPMGPTSAGATAAGWPGTTSSSFTALWRGRWVKQNPRILLDAEVLGDAGATGEVRLVVGGTVVWGPVSVAANTFLVIDIGGDLEFPTVLAPFERHTAELQARRTNASGQVRAVVYGAYGRQT